MRKQIYILFLLLLSVQLALAQTVQYEFWLDNDRDSRITVANSVEEVAIDLDISSLKSGLHYFNFRTQDKSGQWGGISRYLFLVNETEESTQYEYWLDNNYHERTAIKGTATDIPLNLDISSLKTGLHYFNFRAQGKSEQWGGISRYLFFVKQDNLGKLANIEYWIDEHKDVMTQQVTDSTVVIEVDVSSLENGIHTFYMEGVANNGYRSMLNGYEFILSDLPVVNKPTISHEGNMVTITADNDSVDVYYTLDGTMPDSTSIRYETPFEVTRNCVVKAIGMQEGHTSSLIDSLVVDWFKVESIQLVQNGDKLTMTSPTEGAKIFYSMTYTKWQVTETPAEPVPNGYELWMPYSCTVDAYAMKDGWENSDTVHFVYVEPSADYAFDGKTLRVSGEGQVYPVQEMLDNEALTTLCAIVWDVNSALTEEILKGIDNPNLLIYVNDASLAPANTKNVVVNGLAKNIVLTDAKEGNNNFYCPQAFTAEMVSYTREFLQETQVDVSRGWESIALPFTVQYITHEKNATLKPFGAEGNGKPFWLRRLGDNGLTQATKIEANVPYVISMPNNSDAYPAEYNQAGRVTFSAQNVTIPVTDPETLAMADSTLKMVPAFQRIGRSADVWAINIGEVRGKYYEGSVFERDYREVRPFEAYTIHTGNGSAPRFVPINEFGGTTGIETIEYSSHEKDNWFSLDGRKWQQQPTQKGVYINGKRKAVIK